MAYTYLVGWSKLDRWYYGVRWAKGAMPGGLWVDYFTSSKYVAAMRTEFGEPDVVEVRRVFDDGAAAREWEEKVIDRMNCVDSDKWLNRHNKGVEFSQTGIRSVEHREKLRKANTGKVYGPPSAEHRAKLKVAAAAKWNDAAMAAKITAARNAVVSTPEFKKKISDANTRILNDPLKSAQRSNRLKAALTGKVRSAEFKEKISKANTGKTHSLETKEKWAIAKRGRPSNNRWTEESRQKLAATWAKRKLEKVQHAE